MNEKIAVPVAQGQFAMHFGHCEKFIIFEVENKKVKNTTAIIPPPHAPGVLPKFLGEQGVNCIIAGGMGMRAQELFAENGVKVIVGAIGTEPNKLVEEYLSDSLQKGNNICDH
ncbi:MAG: NifB/NifX family molybdenum-iron cluster-binding protein [Candidatus Omnitrophica bacterium]|nr:NifB/NifX family molybdenum-iron cluster-binding protein [Candidatus Omnitrophota bacterium]